MKEKISEAEWKVMEVLWNKKRAKSSEVVEALSDTGWSDKTIKTLLSRLYKKSIVSYEKEGRGYIYSPVAQKEDCIKKEQKAFVEKIFGGSSKAFIANLLSEEKLSKNDIEELRSLLDRKEKEDE